MRRRWKILIALAGLAVCAVLVWNSVRTQDVFGRTYKGRTLADWIDDKSGSADQFVAIQVLCSNGIPALLEAMKYDPKPSRDRIAFRLSWSPGPLRQWLPLSDRGEYRAEVAVAAMVFLGTNAAPAIPILEQLAANTNGLIADRAFYTLRFLGTNSIPWLLPILADTNNPHSAKALELFYSLAWRWTTNVSPEACPLVAQYLHAKSETLVINAAASLSYVKGRPDVCVPALIEALSNTDAHCRMLVMDALGDYGEAARTAVPMLRRLCEDQDPSVGVWATNALSHIAPEVLTNGLVPTPAH